jgi:low affinity Fe/Cu permease
MKNRIGKIILASALLIGGTLPSIGVTKEEMEEARTIAAIVYLRNANNGSDYLNNVSAKTLAELEGKLKDTEKANLATFKSVGMPGDYASWDKSKLVEYWSGTFYSNPEIKKLASLGYARNMTKQRLQAMKVYEPTAAAEETPAPAEENKDENIAEENDPNASLANPMMEENVDDSEAYLKAKEDSIAAANKSNDEASDLIDDGGHTLLYVIILVVLVALMAALVFYATKVFKRQNEEAEEARRQAKIEGMDDDERRRMQAKIDELERSNNDYRNHITTLEERKPEPAPAPVAAPVEKEVIDDRRAQAAPARRPARKIYLGRANSAGMFVRAEKELNPDQSVFRLVSTDGITGTFSVVTDVEVQDRILEDPQAALEYACVCDDYDTVDRTEINTDRNGTAVFESGRWRVLRKAHISLI